MKLVEVLAITLEEWPDKVNYLTRDRDGTLCAWVKAPHFHYGVWEHSVEPKVRFETTFASNIPSLDSNYGEDITTKYMWMVKKGKIREADDKEWREGVDLPPVDTECEHDAGTPQMWEVVKILAHTEVEGVSVAVYQYGNKISFSSGDFFRKIDTKRQERENYIDRIYGVMCKADRPNNRSDMAETLYDVGLRFVEE